MGEIIAVLSGKGGTGVTTVTAALGNALSSRGQKTLLLDLNFQKCDLPVLYGAEDRISWHLLDVIEGNCRIIQAMIPCRKDESLYLLPGSTARELRLIPVSSFVKLTGMFRSSFDFILIDTPSGPSEGCSYALAASDSVIALTDSTLLSRRNTKRLLQLPEFDSVRKSMILNRFERKLLRDGGLPLPEDVAQEIGIPLLGIVPESEEILLSSDRGAVAEDPKKASGKCFDRIAGRLLGEEIPISLK